MLGYRSDRLTNLFLRTPLALAARQYENMNGLLRQYFPKGAELRHYTQKQLDVVAAQINRRPRKRYGYATPDEMIETLTGAMTA